MDILNRTRTFLTKTKNAFLGSTKRPSRRRNGRGNVYTQPAEVLEQRKLMTAVALTNRVALSQQSINVADRYDVGSESNNFFHQSTNLGTGQVNERNLSITPRDRDYFQWTALQNGTVDAKIECDNADGDIDLVILNARGRYVTGSFTNTVDEVVTFDTSAGETFTALVYSRRGRSNPDYNLIIGGFDASVPRDELEISATTYKTDLQGWTSAQRSEQPADR